MRARWGLLVYLLIVAAGAAALRLFDLANRPLHADEAVHAVKFADLLERGDYRYDPHEYHGPTLYWSALPAAWLAGHRALPALTETDLRRGPAVVGVLLVLAVALLLDGLGTTATVVALLLAALSPALVFYSRYFIQETLLAAATLLALGCGWRYECSGRRGWLLACGAAAGLAVASKETAPLALGALALGLLGRPGWRAGRRELGLLLAVTGLVAAGVLSNCGQHPGAALDYFRSYAPWFSRAGGTELHDQGPLYYLRLLAYSHKFPPGPWFSEGLLLGLAAVGLGAVLRRRLPAGADPRLARLIAVYTVVLTAVYSALPYKTPWCLLGFQVGLLLLAGLGAAALLATPHRGLRAACAVGLLLLAGHYGWQATRVVYKYAADRRNPYAYSPTAPYITDLRDTVDRLQRARRPGEALYATVFSPDEYYWPLPWYLKALGPEQVGYYVGGTTFQAAPLVLLHVPAEGATTAWTPFYRRAVAQLQRTHVQGDHLGLRYKVKYETWIAKELWERYLQTPPPPPEEE
ncbi:MAG: TIGR03663 family protein [Fimbriimonadaceae bacterium]|nr:TIGR03663 family protein [Fimbriimonadaceae bacterium]